MIVVILFSLLFYFNSVALCHHIKPKELWSVIVGNIFFHFNLYDRLR